jgi:putative transcriptional regulator
MAAKVRTAAKAGSGTARAPRTVRAKRSTRRETEAEILATAYALGAALHRVGAVDATTMRDLAGLCLPPRPDYDSAEVRRIRAAARMSQPVFARLLGVDKSAVAQWERGVKRPSGPVARLLEVLDPKRSEASPIVRIQREMSSAA